MKTIHEYLDDCLEKWGGEPYIYTKTDSGFVGMSFNEIISSARALAAAIYSGDRNRRIYIYAENSARWMICDLAAMGYAGICVPLDKEWTAFDLENVIPQNDKGIFFYSESKSETADIIRKSRPNMVFYSIEKDMPGLIEKGGKLTVPPPRSDLDSTAKIIFTSGTTARPKAIPLTQRNMFSNAEALFRRTPMDHRDRDYLFLPLSHVYAAVTNFIYTLISGMRIYLCRDLREINSDIISLRPSILCTVPIMLSAMHRLMTEELLDALRQLRFFYIGGSVSDPEMKNWFIERGINLLESYGTTETSVIAVSKIICGKAENVPTLLDGPQVRIADSDENGIGEIVVGGISVMSGYLEVDDNSRYFDSDGYFRTGDLGKLDSEGHLYLFGRKKRMLDTSDGNNVYADEIEDMLKESPMINAAKVYMEDGKISATVFADLISYAREEVQSYVDGVNLRLPKFKRIITLHITDDKPGGRLK